MFRICKTGRDWSWLVESDRERGHTERPDSTKQFGCVASFGVTTAATRLISTKQFCWVASLGVTTSTTRLNKTVWLSWVASFGGTGPLFSPYVNVNYHGLTWTLILRNLVVYELVLVVILNATISQPPAAACSLPWVTEIRYLGIHITQSQLFKCSFDLAKRAFYALNAILGKIDRFASEEVIISNWSHKNVCRYYCMAQKLVY